MHDAEQFRNETFSHSTPGTEIQLLLHECGHTGTGFCKFLDRSKGFLQNRSHTQKPVERWVHKKLIRYLTEQNMLIARARLVMDCRVQSELLSSEGGKAVIKEIAARKWLTGTQMRQMLAKYGRPNIHFADAIGYSDGTVSKLLILNVVPLRIVDALIRYLGYDYNIIAKEIGAKQIDPSILPGMLSPVQSINLQQP